MKTKDWMEKLRIATKTQSWYAVRQALRISDAAVYKLRDGGSIMSPETARRAAEFLDVRDDEIFIDTMVEKAEKRGDKEALAYWRRRAEAFGRHAAVVLLSIAAGLTFHSTESTASLLTVNHSPPLYGDAAPVAARTLYYVKLKNRDQHASYGYRDSKNRLLTTRLIPAYHCNLILLTNRETTGTVSFMAAAEPMPPASRESAPRKEVCAGSEFLQGPAACNC